jgi:hypothetical protein
MGITAEVRASAAASVPPCDPSGLPVGLPESPEPRETSRFLLLPHYMVPVLVSVKAEILRCGSEKMDYRTLFQNYFS